MAERYAKVSFASDISPLLFSAPLDVPSPSPLQASSVDFCEQTTCNSLLDVIFILVAGNQNLTDWVIALENEIAALQACVVIDTTADICCISSGTVSVTATDSGTGNGNVNLLNIGGANSTIANANTNNVNFIPKGDFIIGANTDNVLLNPDGQVTVGGGNNDKIIFGNSEFASGGGTCWGECLP